MEMNEIIIETGKALGLSVTKLANIMIEAQVVSGIISLVVICIFIVAMTPVTRHLYKQYFKNDNSLMFEGMLWWMLIACIIGFVLVSVYPALMKIFAPEYMAIKDTVELLRGFR